MSLEKATGTNDRDWTEIILWTAFMGTAGAIFGRFNRGLRIQGITKGRGSHQAVMRTAFTKMLRYNQKISAKTFVKAVIALTVSRHLIKNILDGVERSLDLKEHIRRLLSSTKNFAKM